MKKSNAIHDFFPNDATTRGATRQVQMVAVASGQHIKNGKLSILSKKSNHTVEYHVASYWYLQAIVDSLKIEDPEGSLN